MPYTVEDARRKFDEVLDRFQRALNGGTTKAGDMNYLMSTMIDKWIMSEGLNYDMLNTALGVLTAMTQELYRRVAAPYEDVKRDLNGEVFFCHTTPPLSTKESK